MSHIRSLHIYLGLLFILPLWVTATTGMILGFHDRIQNSRFPYRLTQPPHYSRPLQQDELIRQFQRTFPSSQLEAIHLSNSPVQSIRIKAKDRLSSHSQIYFLDPTSGKVISQQGSEITDTLEWIYRIHRGTWIGYENRRVMSVLAIGIVFLWLTGGILRKKRNPKKLAFPNLKKKIWPLPLHRSLGLFCGLLVGAMAGTGALMNDMGRLMEWLDPVPLDRESSSHLRPESNLDQKIELVRTSRPDSQLRSIYFPKPKYSQILFYFKDNSRVYLDSSTNEIQKVMSPTQNWVHALYPFHSGRIFGKFSVPFVLCSGVLIWILTLTGLYSTRQYHQWKKMGRDWIQPAPFQKEKITNRLTRSS